MRHLSLWFFWLVLTPSLHAQKTTAEYETSYQTALSLLKAQNYEQARLAFGPLTQQRYTGPRAPYAHYFYGLASLKTNRATEAKGILRQLLERFPTWEKADDARYLLANVLFVEEDYAQALDFLKEIDDPTLRADILNLKEYYLSRSRSLPVLKGLYLTYPDDRVVALALVDMIQRTSTEKADLELSDRLTNRYGIRQNPMVPATTSSTAPPTPTGGTTRKTPAPRSFYNVGVLFPFQVDEIDERNRPVRNTQFALDLYNGIRLAVKKLQAEGTLVNLFAYDVENDGNAMQVLVKNGPFQQMDLLIGPLYAEPYKVAQAWAAEQDVPLVNPISTNRRLIENSPNLFLAQPSLDQQAAAAAQFARQKFGTAPAVVFYGLDRSDSLVAAAYVARLKQQNVDVLALRRNAMGSAETVAAAAPLVEGKRVGHVFVASSQKGSGPAFLNALGRNRFGEVPVLLLAEGFTLANVSASQFSGRDVYLIDPNFVETDRPDVVNFQKTYLSRYNTLPSTFAYWGYDLMLFYGRMLGKFGPDGLRDGLHKQPYRGGDYTLAGFDYTQASNDNQAVPIVTFENYKFVLAK